MIPITKPSIGIEEENAVLEVLRSGRLAQGPKVEEFEKNFAKYIGVKHAVSISSGTTALEIAIAAFDFPKGSEIITTPFSFVATANTIILNDCKPVFADVDEKTFNIDSKLIEEKITDKTVAILPVHLYGQCANMDEINKIAKRHNLKVIEDACQAHGATQHSKKAGSLGDVACFSFYATKNITTCEGGMVTTNNDSLAEKIKLLRNHGQIEKYKIKLFGVNARMTEMQAALGIEQLKKLENFNKRRIEIAKEYDTALKGKYEIPYVENFNTSVYHQYTLRVKNREEVKQKLEAKEIHCGIYYPIPIHLQEPYMKKFGYKKGDFPVSERLSEEVISLPMYPQITSQDVKNVVNALL